MNLVAAALSGVISGGISGTPAALPTGWSVIADYLVGPGANLAGVNLSSADLAGVDLAGAILTGADLSDTDLNGADLNGVVSGGVTGMPTPLPSGWNIVAGHLIGPGANLTDADLNRPT